MACGCDECDEQNDRQGVFERPILAVDRAEGQDYPDNDKEGGESESVAKVGR